ncbi:methyl-accepting chemotaxis protein [Desulfococcaceae bacterium HSG7]|nr:methyl-accepting chemotaxis protein [Desulfococcaceae bacterium HSG7]
MKHFSDWYITTKLLSLNLFIILFIGGGIVALFFAFNHIEHKLIMLVNRDVNDVIENAHVGRELTKVIAATSRIKGVFFDPGKSEKSLKDESDLHIKRAKAIAAQKSDASQLSGLLQQFVSDLEALAEHGSNVHSVLQQLRKTEQQLKTDIINLSDLIAKTVVLVMMEGRDVSGLNQLNLVIPWYNEILTQIDLQIHKFARKHDSITVTHDMSAHDSEMNKIISLTDEFEVRLRPLLDSEPDIETLGQQIIDTVGEHKKSFAILVKKLPHFIECFNRIDETQTSMLTTLSSIDDQIAGAAQEIGGDVAGAIASSKIIIEVTACVIIFVILLGQWGARRMVRPLLVLSEIAKQLAEGDINCDIKWLDRIKSANEIGVLASSFQKLIAYNQEMAMIATGISIGDLRGDIKPRSERDVLGHAFLNMTAYLNEIAGSAKLIGSGDLRYIIEPKSKDDILGHAFQQMRKLHQSIAGIMNSATKLNNSSRELDQVSTQMASATEQTSQQANVIAANSRQISNNADAVAAATEQMSANISSVSENAEEAMEMVRSASDKVTTSCEIIDKATVRSQEIGKIINVITRIAEQTRLLALNATIEAANAGTAGKGFTVIAKEISDLSQKSAASAENITHKLKAIKSGSNDAAVAMAEVTAIITLIRSRAESTAGGMEEQSVTINDIAQRMAESAGGSRDITQGVAEMAAIAQQTSQSAADVHSASFGLAMLSKNLQKLVNRFKI